MPIITLQDISLKVIKMTKSHAAQAQDSKDNFKEIERYINNIRLRLDSVEGTTPTVTSTTITNVVRNDMIKTVWLKTTHVDGTTETQSGVSVTRSGNNFVIQTPSNVPVLFHNLRIKSSKKYASGYTVTMDASNQVTLYFEPFIKEDLEFIIFG